jgi:hypothetical protein
MHQIISQSHEYIKQSQNNHKERKHQFLATQSSVPHNLVTINEQSSQSRHNQRIEAYRIKEYIEAYRAPQLHPPGFPVEATHASVRATMSPGQGRHCVSLTGLRTKARARTIGLPAGVRAPHALRPGASCLLPSRTRDSVRCAAGRLPCGDQRRER